MSIFVKRNKTETFGLSPSGTYRQKSNNRCIQSRPFGGIRPFCPVLISVAKVLRERVHVEAKFVEISNHRETRFLPFPVALIWRQQFKNDVS
jgi:hypothetical protein